MFTNHKASAELMECYSSLVFFLTLYVFVITYPPGKFSLILTLFVFVFGAEASAVWRAASRFPDLSRALKTAGNKNHETEAKQ